MDLEEYNRIWERWRKLLPMVLLPLLSVQLSLRAQAEEPEGPDIPEAEENAGRSSLGDGEPLYYPGNIKELTFRQVELPGAGDEGPVTWRLDSSTQQYFQAASDDAIADEARVSVEDTLPRVGDLRQQGVLQSANVAYFPARGDTGRIVHVRSYLFETPGAARTSEIFQELRDRGEEIASTGPVTRLHREAPPTAVVLWGNALVVARQDFAGRPVYRQMLDAYIQKLEKTAQTPGEQSPGTAD